eukprot:7063-Heterococcus_DN1.PRE.3
MPFVIDDDDDDDDNDAANVFSQLLMLSPCSALCQVFISVLCTSIPDDARRLSDGGQLSGLHRLSAQIEYSQTGLAGQNTVSSVLPCVYQLMRCRLHNFMLLMFTRRS